MGNKRMIGVSESNREISMERVPPQNIEAEMAVLGSTLIEEEAIPIAIEILSKSYFYKEAHNKIFTAVLDLYQDNKAVDLITLTELLKKRGELEEVGGPSYLASLVNTVPTAANIEYYAKIVKEKYLLRSLINVATSIVSESYESKEEADHLLDKAEKMVFDIASRRVEGGFVELKEIVKKGVEVIDTLYQKKTYITGIPTGLGELDKLTAGLQDSDLIIMAGRPSMGKSSLTTCIAEYAGITEGKAVAIFSMEMSKEQLGQRMLCSHARVDLSKVRSGFLSQSDWPHITFAAGKLSEAKIFIDDTSMLTPLELRAKARRMKSRYGISLIVIDYLQLMSGTGRFDSRQQEISEISRNLKALARELNIPVIAVSQLSRAPEKREGNRPVLSDLRESGALEQDADVVMFLFREEYYKQTEENKGKTEIIVAKQRNGPTGIVKLTFIKEYTRFESLSTREE